MLYWGLKSCVCFFPNVRACLAIRAGLWARRSGEEGNLDQWLHFVQDYCQMDTFSAAFTYVNMLKGWKAVPGAPSSLLAPAQGGLRWRTLLETSLLLSCWSTASVSSSASFPGSFTQQLQLSVWWGWCNVSRRQTWLSAARGLARRGDGGQPGDLVWRPRAGTSSREAGLLGLPLD